MIDLKPFTATIGQKPVAVFGLGLSGLSAVRALRAAEAGVVAWDDQVERRIVAEESGAQIVDLAQADLSGFACLVLSPGVPLHFPAPHPVVLKARAAGLDILGDIELLHRAGHGRRTIGITGTNGKSTTTALAGHVLNRCGIAAVTGGNIGHAVLDLTLPARDSSAVVLELSSYQLDLCTAFSPDIAVHLNLTPDHIDRHGDIGGYVAAKMRIFRGPGIAVIGADDPHSLQMMEQIRAAGERRVFPVTATRPLQGGVYALNGMLYDALYGDAAEIGSLHDLKTLPGTHNHQNIAAVYAIARSMGLGPEAILAAMKTYPGLPHRMFTIRHINGVGYVDDSKATNADAAGKALSCHRNIYWILGGRPKEGGLKGLESLTDRVIHAYVIGEAAEEFSAWLKNQGIPFTRSDTLERAVNSAHLLAQQNRGQPGGAGVVLLSPACASFDQFRSFEHRGQVFADLVNALTAPQEAAAG